MANPQDEYLQTLTRRAFLNRCTIGTAALAALLNQEAVASENPQSPLPHFAPKAKRVIYLFQSGGPSQMDLFDPKPGLEKFRGQNLPESIRQGQRLNWNDCVSDQLPNRAFTVQIRAARSIRRDAQRIAAAHGKDG